jgi:hypothetical protein
MTVGDQIRSNHPYAYHSGEWANIVAEITVLRPDGTERPCWAVTWPNGDADEWPKDDPAASYEFQRVPA